MRRSYILLPSILISAGLLILLRESEQIMDTNTLRSAGVAVAVIFGLAVTLIGKWTDLLKEVDSSSDDLRALSRLAQTSRNRVAVIVAAGVISSMLWTYFVPTVTTLPAGARVTLLVAYFSISITMFVELLVQYLALEAARAEFIVRKQIESMRRASLDKLSKGSSVQDKEFRYGRS